MHSFRCGWSEYLHLLVFSLKSNLAFSRPFVCMISEASPSTHGLLLTAHWCPSRSRVGPPPLLVVITSLYFTSSQAGYSWSLACRRTPCTLLIRAAFSVTLAPVKLSTDAVTAPDQTGLQASGPVQCVEALWTQLICFLQSASFYRCSINDSSLHLIYCQWNRPWIKVSSGFGQRPPPPQGPVRIQDSQPLCYTMWRALTKRKDH